MKDKKARIIEQWDIEGLKHEIRSAIAELAQSDETEWMLHTVGPDWRGQYILEDALEFFEEFLEEPVNFEDEWAWEEIDRIASDYADVLTELVKDALGNNHGLYFGTPEYSCDYGLILYVCD